MGRFRADLATAQRELGELTRADLRQVCADCEKQLFNNIAKMLDAGNVPSAGLDVEWRVALLLDDNDVLAGQAASLREAIAYATTVEPEAYLCDNEGRTGVILTSDQFVALEDAAQATPLSCVDKCPAMRDQEERAKDGLATLGMQLAQKLEFAEHQRDTLAALVSSLEPVCWACNAVMHLTYLDIKPHADEISPETHQVQHYACPKCGRVMGFRTLTPTHAEQGYQAAVAVVEAAPKRDELRHLYWETCKTCEHSCVNEGQWKQCEIKQRLDVAEKVYDDALAAYAGAKDGEAK